MPFALHSDAPITQLSPLFTAWCAAKRETSSGRLLGESLRLPVDDALRAITMGAAFSLGMDHLIGSIEVGKYADFAVLDADPYEVPLDDLRQMPVWGTVLGGEIFRAPA